MSALNKEEAEGAKEACTQLLDADWEYEDGCAGLMWTSGYGQTSVIKMLLSRGANIEADVYSTYKVEMQKQGI